MEERAGDAVETRVARERDFTEKEVKREGGEKERVIRQWTNGNRGRKILKTREKLDCLHALNCFFLYILILL